MTERPHENLNYEIERLLETSSIAPLLKAIVKASLPTMSLEGKLSVLESLKKEHQKLIILKARQEKIIEKYRGIMEGLSKQHKV